MTYCFVISGKEERVVHAENCQHVHSLLDIAKVICETPEMAVNLAVEIEPDVPRESYTIAPCCDNAPICDEAETMKRFITALGGE